MTEHHVGADWASEACTLPTVERPLRSAEFDDLFAHDVVGVVRDPNGDVRLTLRADADVAARAAHLAVRETGCCSFFAFALDIEDSGLALTVSAGQEHDRVLAALAARADSRRGASA